MELGWRELGSQVKETTLPSPQQKVHDGVPFPLILTPTNPDDFPTIESTLEWMRKKRAAVEEKLLKYGAVLFRGFPLQEASHFNDFVNIFEYDPLPYIGGSAPRNQVVGNVFTANESPPEAPIPFHHEMSQVPVYPKVLFFYCDKEPAGGGQTPIVPSHLAYKRMKEKCPDFVDEVEKGVIYRRVLCNGTDPVSPIGRGWQATYGSEDRAVAEKNAKELCAKVEWLPDGCMRTVTDALPAVRIDPRTGKKVWFNHIITHYRGWVDSRNKPEESVVFADGSPMPPKTMDILENVLNDLASDFIWQKGDVVMIDNRQVLHGRRSFTPPRRVLASLFK